MGWLTRGNVPKHQLGLPEKVGQLLTTNSENRNDWFSSYSHPRFRRPYLRKYTREHSLNNGEKHI